ncbi:MAG: FkbM family methyltransferase [Crocinitomicaceae bacterium]
MKNAIKYILQKLLGYQKYLFVFAKRKIKTLKTDKKEGDFFAFMDAIKGEGDLLDVGANIGIMSYHLSKQFSDRAVLAIEPMPSNLSVLMRIKEHFNLNNVEVVPTAVGDKDGESVEMVLPLNGKVKMQGLAHVVHDSITEWNEGEKFSITSDTLDTICEGRSIAGIKMDIENYEIFALRGAKKLIEKDHPVVYLELWENENRHQCFAFLESMGYKAYVNSDQGLILFDPAIHKKQNFVFK